MTDDSPPPPPGENGESDGPDAGSGFDWGRILIFLGVVAVASIALAATSGRGEPAAGHYGFPSLLPALTTLVLVFATRDVVSALFAGIVMGGLVVGDPNLVQRFLIPSIGSESFAVILLVYLWALGGLIGIWTRTGGARHFAEWAARHIVRGPKTAKFFGWIVGVIFHQGGTISTILAGTTVRPVTDREDVSHEEISYVIDSTASPVATIIPLNAWPLYIASLLVGTIPLFETQQDVVTFFFRSIPLNFYGIFAITMTFLFAWELLPWEGRRMREARERARSTGKLDRDGADPLSSSELTELRIPDDYRPALVDFVLPLVVLIGVALTGVVRPLAASIRAADWSLFLSEVSVPIAEAFGLAVLTALVLAILRGMKVKEAIDGFVDGCKGVTIGAIILALAVTLGNVSKELGTAAYIVEHTAEAVPGFILPAVFLVICMAVAFSVGSSWGTYAVVFPLAMPLAYAVNPDPFFLSLAFGAVLGGAVFGDQCSPISDTTILSSLATGADLMDHVFTQLPLALTAAGLGGVLYTILALVGG